jgi:hypothetical protein
MKPSYQTQSFGVGPMAIVFDAGFKGFPKVYKVHAAPNQLTVYDNLNSITFELVRENAFDLSGCYIRTVRRATYNVMYKYRLSSNTVCCRLIKGSTLIEFTLSRWTTSYQPYHCSFLIVMCPVLTARRMKLFQETHEMLHVSVFEKVGWDVGEITNTICYHINVQMSPS